LPRYFKNANACILKHLPGESPPYDRRKGEKGIKATTPLFRKWLVGIVLVFFAIAAAVTIANIRSYSPGETLKIWHAVSTKTVPATVCYYTLCAAAVLAASIVFAYHCSVMMQLRAIISLDKKSDVTLSIAPGTPIDAMLSSLLHLLYLIALIPICVIFGRTIRADFSLFDPVTMFNMIIAPVIMFSVAILPFSLTGIPKYLRMKRKKLIGQNARRMSKIWDKLYQGAQDYDREELLKTIDFLAKEKALIQKHCPRSPLVRHTKVTVTAVSSLPAVLSIARVVLGFLKGLD